MTQRFADSTDGMKPTSSPDRAIPWRWYHFYFLLALFDIVVIVASLTLYHRTLTSYELALQGLTQLEKQQDWIADVRRTVIQLNAPGNDVFESRNPAFERSRFETTHNQIKGLLRREGDFAIDLGDVRQEIMNMTEQELIIFEIFDTIDMKRDPQQELSRATVAMAAMDRHQAAAVDTLSQREAELHSREQTLLSAYGEELQDSAAFEKYFLGVVALILVGIFWYGRKLQRMHEEMIENQQHALAERHERLASVGEVCSAVAHGIRNPLSGITTSAQLALEYGTLDNSTQLRLKDVLSEARRLDGRISKLLSFAKGGVDPRGVVDLRDIVVQAVDEMVSAAEVRDITIKSTSCAHMLRINGSAEELVQAVIELVANAIDHAPDGSTIEVTCAPTNDGRHALVRVTDGGEGIPDHVIDHVFDLFFTTKAEGHGVGLASVKRTIESHHGQISISSQGSRGAVVEASLPLA